jgi:hypothetical protein
MILKNAGGTIKMHSVAFQEATFLIYRCAPATVDIAFTAS